MWNRKLFLKLTFFFPEHPIKMVSALQTETTLFRFQEILLKTNKIFVTHYLRVIKI